MAWLALLPALASEPATLYELTTETGMPHLEENLRYASVTERRCLRRQDLEVAFWMLRDVSLSDCTLHPLHRDASSAHYELQCRGGHGTSGQARWQLGDEWLRGTLSVRLGGKNMTFHQRITARPMGPCR